MTNSAVDFIHAVAWPAVAALGIILLIPGGYLLKIIDKITDNTSKIATTIISFSKLSEKLAIDIERFQKSFSIVSNELLPSLSVINEKLDVIKENINAVDKSTTEIRIYQGKDEINELNVSQSIPLSDGIDQDILDHESISIDDMFDDISLRWNAVSNSIRDRMGADNFDGRIVATMAWRLSHGGRTHPLSKIDAELISNLQSQIKRFRRLQGTREDWLNYSVYESFVAGVDKALAALNQIPEFSQGKSR